MTYTIEPQGAGFAYKIFINGQLSVHQKHTPGAAGFVPMTESEAEAYAIAEIAAAAATEGTVS